MGFGLCLGEQRGSSHVSCAEGRASRAVNAAEVEGSVIPWLLAILTAFSISLSLFSPSLSPPRSSLPESRKSSQKSLWIRRPTAGKCRDVHVSRSNSTASLLKRFKHQLLECYTLGDLYRRACFGRLQRVRKDSVFSPGALLLLMFLWSGRCCVFNNTADAAPKHMALISHPHAELTAEPPSVLMSWPRDARTRWGSF